MIWILLCSVWFFIFTFFLCNIFLLLLFLRLSLFLSIIEVIITIAFSFFRFKTKSTEFEWWRFNSHSAENYTKAKKYVVTFWTLLNSQSIYPFVCPTVHPSIHPNNHLSKWPAFTLTLLGLNFCNIVVVVVGVLCIATC